MNRAIVLFDPSKKKTNLQHCLKFIKILTHLYEMQRLTGNTKKYGNSSKYDIRLTNIELNTIAMYYPPLFFYRMVYLYLLKPVGPHNIP